MRVDTQVFNVLRYLRVAHHMRALRPITTNLYFKCGVISITAAFCITHLYAQDLPSNAGVPDPNLVAPQIVIDVEPAQAGSEIVRITIDSSTYPDDLLRQQIQNLSTYTGRQVRVASISRHVVDAARDLVFIKAHLGTNNLIDQATGGLNLQAILRSFAGAPAPHTLSSFQISFSGVTPTEQTLSNFVLSDRVVVAGNFIELPPSIDYRILLLTQDPDEIFIPVTHQPEVELPEEEPARRPIPWTIILLSAVALLAAGGLVYFVLLNFGRRK